MGDDQLDQLPRSPGTEEFRASLGGTDYLVAEDSAIYIRSCEPFITSNSLTCFIQNRLSERRAVEYQHHWYPYRHLQDRSTGRSGLHSGALRVVGQYKGKGKDSYLELSSGPHINSSVRLISLSRMLPL